MPSTLSGLLPAAEVVSAVAMAMMAAFLLSATKRMPSGPKASGPMDWNEGVPCFIPAVQFSARLREEVMLSASNVTSSERAMVFIESFPLMETAAPAAWLPQVIDCNNVAVRLIRQERV